MPELPEVESERLQVDRVLRNQRLVKVEAAEDHLVFGRLTPRMINAHLTGRKIRGSDRRGKYFWLVLDRKPYPVFHFGMSGYAEILKPGEKPRTQSLKLLLQLKNGQRVAFYDPRRFGRIRFQEDPLHEAPISNLGHDPLHGFPSAKALAKLLEKRKAPIKSVLLDQKLFAGVGNWIADEILFQSRINPHRRASDLDFDEIKRLRHKLLSIIRTAVKVRADDTKFPKDWLFHHRWGKRKNSQTAKGHRIRHSVIGGRTTAWVEGYQT